MTILSESVWRERSKAHYERVNRFAVAARKRSSRQEKHPVYDFLTRYYPFSLGKFEKWEPGIGVKVEGADQKSFSSTYYQFDQEGCWLDSNIMSDKERQRLLFSRNLLEHTQSRKGVYSCFGMHEWAMVYTGADVRHREIAPLRLSQEEIDATVRARPLVCTHFDAFRFFSPEAKPLNKHQPNLDDRISLEQPACIHANMDLYKWAFKSKPWVGSDLVWECFQLALKAREIDMRASPYNLSEWGYDPIPIETEKGRVEYQFLQKELEEEGRILRTQLILVLTAVTGAC